MADIFSVMCHLVCDRYLYIYLYIYLCPPVLVCIMLISCQTDCVGICQHVSSLKYDCVVQH